jgi:hypothetical protein
MSSRPNAAGVAAQAFIADAPDDMVAEVAGPPFSPVEAGAAIGLGVLALLIAGLFGLLLAALAEEHRISASGIGFVTMLEALTTGLVTSLAGILLKPVRLKTIGVVATLAVIALDLATVGASGRSIFIVRGLAGAAEGVLLWISIGFISRTATPERWAAVLFTGMGVTQLIAATVVSALVLPRFGANGGYAAVAAIMVLALPVALFLPSRLGAVAGAEDATSGAPPFRGWVALFGTLCMAASLTAVAIYVVPLAEEAGLSVAAGRTAISASLGFNMIGGALAAWLGGRVRYVAVFYVCAAIFVGTWAVYALHSPAWLFVAATALAGLAAYVAGPFLVPMTVEADPSRRAAMQSGAVQLMAGALGPLLAGLSVRGHEIRGVLVLALVLQALGLGVATALHRIAAAEARGR